MFGLLDSLSLANGRGLMTGFFWTGTSVYSPTLEGIRNGFWEDLALIQHRWGGLLGVFLEISIQSVFLEKDWAATNLIWQ